MYAEISTSRYLNCSILKLRPVKCACIRVSADYAPSLINLDAFLSESTSSLGDWDHDELEDTEQTSHSSRDDHDTPTPE